MLRAALSRACALLGAVLFGGWAISIKVLDWIGRGSVADDYQQFLDRLPRWADWLFSTPWWVPATLAAILTGFLVWLSWPPKQSDDAGITKESSPQLAPETVTTSRCPISPLKTHFADEAIALSDFYDPGSVLRTGVAMTNVELVGPGLFLFGDSCHTFKLEYADCNFVIVDKTKPISGAVGFTGSQFNNCRFIRITICMNREQFSDLQRQGPNLPYNVISESGASADIYNGNVIEDAIVVSSTTNKGPEYRARFAENGRNVAFYLEYSAHVTAMGFEGWTQPRKILMHTQDRFARGEIVSFPIGHAIRLEQRDRWRFAPSPSGDASDLSDLLNPSAWYRGRITSLDADGLEQHCYFIAETGKCDSGIPQVIGEHMFNHVFEWEGKPCPAGNPDLLSR